MRGVFKLRIMLRILFLLFTITSFPQQIKLSAEVDILLEKKKIKSDFLITNYDSSKTTNLKFTLHNQIKVTSIHINKKKVNYRKTTEECLDCTIYNISLKKPILKNDSLQIKTKGHFDNFNNGENKLDYKGNIVANYNILRASEQSKWYPIIFDNNQKLQGISQKTEYLYNIKATCKDCENIYIGSGTPQKQKGKFTSKKPTANIMLIAGDYDWLETDSTIYINTSNDIDYIDHLFSKIINFYEHISPHKLPEKFTFAHLPSDNNQWNGFVTQPTIVNTTKKIDHEGLENFLSHEIAHYLFGGIYKPKSNLYWFYLESFAEYYSLKYRLKHKPKTLKESYLYLNDNNNFVTLNNIKKSNSINNVHRYLIGPFQLLAIEHKIGETKMTELIDDVFSNINNNDDGYMTFIRSLKKINIQASTIDDIENNIFRKFDSTQYLFLKGKIY